MQQGDYSSAPYYQFPHLQNPNPLPSSNPNPSDPLPNPYASAPPFTPNYAAPSSDYPSSYPSYPPNPDPIPPTAPPSYPPQSYNPPPYESIPSYQQPPYYPPYDQNYAPPPNPIPNSTSSLYNHGGSSLPPIPSYETPYDNPVKSDYGGGGAYFDDRYGSFNRTRSDPGSDLYGKRHDGGGVGGGDDGFGDGVYAYEGGKVEPYGARGTAPKSSTWSSFDDYGRSISVPSPKESSPASKIVKAVPKVDVQEDVRSAVQKFRVKMLAESVGQGTMDVLCQVCRG